MNLNGKEVDLVQLQAELADAGIVVPALGTAGDDLHTYDEAGAPIDLPSGAAAVLDAHRAPRPRPGPASATAKNRDDLVLSVLEEKRTKVSAASVPAGTKALLLDVLDGLSAALAPPGTER